MVQGHGACQTALVVLAVGVKLDLLARYHLAEVQPAFSASFMACLPANWSPA